MKDLTVSAIDRQNILNNINAVEDIQKYLGIGGMLFQGEYRYTKKQVTDFFVVDSSTIERYLANNETELKHNGYEIFKGKKLKEFKEEFGWLLDNGAKAPQLGIFNFRAFLNLGMLLSESEKAKALRSAMLDIVLDTVNKRLGGNTKYINQRDEEFFLSIIKEPRYRKEFTQALKDYLEMGNYKYAYYTDKIYEAIFKEKAKEYRQVLELKENENVRDTMYSEVLNLIASFETGLSHKMKAEFEKKGNEKLTPYELDNIFLDFSTNPLYKPLLENARTKMASRDYGLRDIIHASLSEYIHALSVAEFERFLGEKSKSLEKRIEENIDVFKKLRDY
jgi:hypothetical protein